MLHVEKEWTGQEWTLILETLLFISCYFVCYSEWYCNLNVILVKRRGIKTICANTEYIYIRTRIHEYVCTCLRGDFFFPSAAFPQSVWYLDFVSLATLSPSARTRKHIKKNWDRGTVSINVVFRKMWRKHQEIRR